MWWGPFSIGLILHDCVCVRKYPTSCTVCNTASACARIYLYMHLIKMSLTYTVNLWANQLGLKAILFFLFFEYTGLKRLHKKELITSEECRSLVRSSFASMLSLQLKKSADVRQKTVEELPWRMLGGIMDTILMQKFECKCIAWGYQ